MWSDQPTTEHVAAKGNAARQVTHGLSDRDVGRGADQLEHLR